MHVGGITLLLFVLLSFCSEAVATSGITYHGRLLKPDGTPVDGSNVQFRLQVRTPGAEDCLLFEEIQSANLSATNGTFAVSMADGNGARQDSNAWNLFDAFSNRKSFTFPAASCTSGTTYTPNPSDNRRFRVYFNDGSFGGWEALPVQALNYIPMAIESYAVGGFPASSLLRVETAGVLGTPAPITSTQYNELLALLAGSSIQYSAPNELNGSVLPTIGSGQSVRWSGTAWEAYTPPTNASLPTCTAGQVLFSNGTALSCIADGSSATVNGDDITSGTIGGTTAWNTSGNITTTGSITGGSLAGSTISTRDVRVYESTNTNYVSIVAPAGLTPNYTLTLPVDDGTGGQVLSTNGSGVLSWVTPATGNLNLSNIRSTVNPLNHVFPSVACATSETLRYDSLADRYTCSAISMTATDISNGAAGNIAAISLQAAINELDTEKVAKAGDTMTGTLIVPTVGIGTSTPGSQLAIGSTNIAGGGTQELSIGVPAGTNTAVVRVGQDTTHNAYFAWQGHAAAADAYASIGTYGGTNPLVLQGLAGNVGIGTNAPDTRLHVAGTLKIADGGETCSTGNGGMIRYAGTALHYCNGTAWQTLGSGTGAGDLVNGGNAGAVVVGSNDNTLTLESNNAARMTFLSTGEIGIGTTTPGYKLDLRGTTGSQLHISSSAADTGGYLMASGNDVYLNSSATHNGSNWIAKATSASLAAQENGYFRIYSNSGLTAGNAFTPTPRMSVSPNGVLVGSLIAGQTSGNGLEVASDSGGLPRGVTSTQYSSNFTGGAFLGRKSRGAPGSMTAVQSADQLAVFAASGYDGSSWVDAGSAEFVVSGTVATGSVPTDFTISTGNTGGSERVRVTSGGLMGIGTNNPARLLHVNGPMRVTASGLPITPGLGDIAIDSGDANNLKWYNGTTWQSAGGTASTGDISNGGNATGAPITIGTNDANALNFETASTPKMTISMAGLVGIGTTTPAQAHHVYGNLNSHVQSYVQNATDGTSASAAYRLASGGNGFSMSLTSPTNSSGSAMTFSATGAIPMTFSSANLERMRIAGNGHVGIGTSNPTAKLEVSNGNIKIGSLGDGIGFSPGHRDITWDGGGTLVRDTGYFTFITDSNNDMTGGFSFMTGATTAASATALMTVLNNGNVGIGTTNPGSKLEVSGEVRGSSFYSNGDIPFNGGVNFWMNRSDNTKQTYLGFGKANAQQFLIGQPSGGEHLIFDSQAAGNFVFKGGNVGIGTTTPGATLEVIGTGRVMTTTTGLTYLDVLNTSDSAGSDGSVVRIVSRNVAGNGPAIVDLVKYKNGTFNISNTETNAAAATLFSVAGAERMRITSNGSVGIGAPVPSYTLHVNGTAGKPGGGSWTDSSDRRLKKDIQPMESSLDQLLLLKPVTYEWIHPDAHALGRQSGFLAQDVEKVFPGWVSENAPPKGDESLIPHGEKSKSLSFPHDFNAYVVKAFHEVVSWLRIHDREIASLKEENRMLKEYLCSKDPNAPLCK